jgi:hypothetical protein
MPGLASIGEPRSVLHQLRVKALEPASDLNQAFDLNNVIMRDNGFNNGRCL